MLSTAVSCKDSHSQCHTHQCMRQVVSLTHSWVGAPLRRRAAAAQLARLASVCRAALASKGPAPPPPTPHNITYPSATELDGQVSYVEWCCQASTFKC